MKRQKITQLLVTVLSFEMVFAPMAHAIDSKNVAKGFEVGSKVINQLMSGQNPLLGASPNMHLATDMAALQGQQTPQTDKHFNPQKLSRIPGLGEYLARNNINPQLLDCKTLPTTIHEAKNEVCRIGITADKGHPGQQLQEAFAYYNQYTQINKLYKNYTAISNVDGQLFGIGCMRNAMDILNGFFRQRLDELDALTTKMEAIQHQFAQASKADLDAIKESTAVLEGGNSELANEVRTRRPDLFDFGKRFNNPACSSIMTGEDFNKMGKEKGLNSIQKDLKNKLTTKVGPNGYSGESYAKAHTSVVQDINSMADKVAKQMELNFGKLGSNYSDVLGGFKGLSSSNGIGSALSADIFSDVQTNFVEKSNDLNSELRAVSSEFAALGIKQNFEMIRDINSKSLDGDLKMLERGINNACLRRSANLDEVLGKMRFANASDFANENASSFMKKELERIVNDDRISLEKKLAELKSLDNREGGRYTLKLDNAYTYKTVGQDGKVIEHERRAGSNTPTEYLTHVILNCQTQFKSSPMGEKLSGSQAIKKLRDLNQQYKSLAKENAQKAREAVRNKLISCGDSNKANNTIVGSCSAGLFDTSKPGFCANAALSCSKNMQTCTQQAEKFTRDIKAERTARVNNYKNLMENNKRQVVALFDQELSRFMREGEALRGLFGAGFTSPSDIQREVPENAKYLSAFQRTTANSEDGVLMLEDPDKFIELFKRNVHALKASAEKQMNEIVGPQGPLMAHIKQTERNYKEVQRDSMDMAMTCLNKHDSFLAQQEQQRIQHMNEMTKRNQEIGEKSQEFCRRYSMAMEHPGPACKGNIQDLTSAISQMGYAHSANEFEVVCDSYNNESKVTDISGNAIAMCKVLGHKRNTDGKDAIVTQLCENYYEVLENQTTEEGRKKYCNTTTYNAGNAAPTVGTNCAERLDEITKSIHTYYSSIYAHSSDAIRVSPEYAPAFCNAVHDGGRGTVKDIFHGIRENILGQGGGASPF